MENRFKGDIKAIDEGKYQNNKSIKDDEYDDDELEDIYNSDGENNQLPKKSLKSVVNEQSDNDEEYNSQPIEKKRKRSYSPQESIERTIRSQVVIKEEKDSYWYNIRL